MNIKLTEYAFEFKSKCLKFESVNVREAFKKKIAEKETLVHMGGRGVKKIPFF